MEQMLKQVVRQSEELYGVFRQLESESATRGEKSDHCWSLLVIMMICGLFGQLQSESVRGGCCEVVRVTVVGDSGLLVVIVCLLAAIGTHDA